jgi:ergothioneine biosynthesis protein EgtB
MTCRTAPAVHRESLQEQFHRVRAASETMCASLSAEEYRLQPADEVSPPWWNLAHTSWFFVRNLILPFGGRRDAEDELYDHLLNSYYASLGDRLPRGSRGLLSRPTTQEVYRYRASVDSRIDESIGSVAEERFDEFASLLTIGMQHEQQHQELFHTEIKCILAQNPPALRRAFCAETRTDTSTPAAALRFRPYEGGLFEFGHQEDGWCWDNELPVHRYYLEPFGLAERLVTNGEFLDFIEDGGYSNQLLWLDQGWEECRARGWQAPLYWEQHDAARSLWTLSGMRRLALDEPVCHVSFYEAEAYARWRSQTFGETGVRLPTEREWEQAARLGRATESEEAFLESGRLHPCGTSAPEPLRQMHGCLWQWTASFYQPYPRYRPFAGALAEYNGKFMDNQRVLRGGSCVTPRSHYRLSYRNFWPASTRFQFTGIRLARDEGD